MSVARNVSLIRILSVLWNGQFWLGIWVLYYLKFGDLAGIGLIESTMILTNVIAEIPTGAIADLLGRRKTLIIASLLQAVGQIALGVSPSFGFVVLSVVTLTIGYTFRSGTTEALLYDSAKQLGDTRGYEKELNLLSRIEMISIAFFSLVGGLMYPFWNGFPYVACGMLALLATVLCSRLVEPSVDTEKFSLQVFWQQTQKGLRHLFTPGKLLQQTMVMLAVSFVVVVMFELLDDVLITDLGFAPKLLGFVFAAASVIAAGVTGIFERFPLRWGLIRQLLFFGGIVGFSLLLTPLGGVVLGLVLVVVRTSVRYQVRNLVSVIINQNTRSQERATTLSTFSLLQNIPYIFFAYYIGMLADILTPQWLAFWLGVLMLVLLLISAKVLSQRKVVDHE